MPSVSRSHLIDLASKYGIELDDTELEETQRTVNSKLRALESIDRLPLVTNHSSSDRSWTEPDPGDNPYNAIITPCHIPPVADHNGSLDGFTVGLKDNIAVSGVPMTCGSPVIQGYIPDADATVVKRLRAAGATITAKTNLDEFGNTGQGANGFRGPIRNPYDGDRTAGGSSGGSAVAVATDQVRVAFGTDTGGSVRIPAAYCGVIGLKPSHGIIPMTGVFENTYILDHAGPMARSVRDIAFVLDAVAGKDESDPASTQAAGTDQYRVGGYLEAVRAPPSISDLTIGIIPESLGGVTTQAVANRIRTAIDILEDAGATTDDVEIPFYDRDNQIKNAISLVANASHWATGGLPVRRDGGFSTGYAHQPAFAQRKQTDSRTVNTNFRAKVLAGAALIEADHGRLFRRAYAAKREIGVAYSETMSTVDCLVTPTMPTVPPRFTDSPTSFNYSQNVRLANLTQAPAITLPLEPIDGLPVGLQLMADRFNDAELLGLAAAVDDRLSST